MTDSSLRDRLPIDPFAAFTRGITEPDPVRAALRAAGPVAEATAPAGGRVWIVTEADLARRVMAHPHIGKDPALAPPGWEQSAGLEPTAARQPALTTLDGPAHTELRRAHAPLLSAKRVREQSGRIHDIARDLLTEAANQSVDLMDGFTVRFPVMVLLDLLGIDPAHLDTATTACRWMLNPTRQGEAIAELSRIAEAGLDSDGGSGLAAELRDRVPAATTPQQLHYHVFALIFAGQLTTDASLGFLMARVLTEDEHRLPVTPETVDDAVRETLREHPPAPYSLWRFTTAPVELAGTRIPARSPILVDIQGVNTAPATPPGTDLTFGSGPHYCIGAQLAQLELRAVATVLTTDFPHARLDIPYRRLRQSNLGGIQGTRLTALPVTLRPNDSAG